MSYSNIFISTINIGLEFILPEYQKLLGEHPYTAIALNSISNYYQAIGDYDNAIKYTTQALKMRKCLLGDHQETARSYYDLGVAQEGNICNVLLSSAQFKFAGTFLVLCISGCPLRWRKCARLA